MEDAGLKPTERFTKRADDYVVGRPSYPEAAIDLLFEGLREPALLHVVDLGAGTGISSRLLAARGASVIAIEPNTAMRENAESAVNVLWHAGTAEDTGLGSASADLVTAFQAFHWFDYRATLREIKRILRPGGRVALVYNERDHADKFTAAYSAVVRRYATDGADETARKTSEGRAIFTAFPAWSSIRLVEIENAQSFDRTSLHARARSASYSPKEGPAAQALHAALDALFTEHSRNDKVMMRMNTTVTIASD